MMIEYLIIFKFKNPNTSLEFRNLVNNHYKTNNLEEFEDEDMLYFSIPLDRHDMVIAMRHTVSMIKSNIDTEDFVYVVSDLKNLTFEAELRSRDIIIGREAIYERDKIMGYLNFLANEGKLNS